jgi:hypothetical protein
MTGTGRELPLAERIEQMRDRDRRHAELMALPVKPVCECISREDENLWAGSKVDPQCPDHGIRAAQARVLTDEELDQLRQDMGYDTYER